MTDATPAPSGLASVPVEILARRLDRQRAAGEVTLFAACTPADRARVARWCAETHSYPELAAALTAPED